MSHYEVESYKKRVIARLKRYIALYKIYRMIFYEPSNFQNIVGMFMLPHTDLRCREKFLASLDSDPESRELLETQPKIKFDLSSKINLPKNTLGYQYAQFLKQNKLQHFVMPEKNSKYAYAVNRVIQTHDIYHVLLNATPRYCDEFRVASFTVAQLNAYYPASVMIGASLISMCFQEPDLCAEIYSAISKGTEQGKSASQLFTQDWDNLWECDVEELRKKFNIQLDDNVNAINSPLTEPVKPAEQL